MTVIMEFEEKTGGVFQLWKEGLDNEIIFAISSDAVPISELGQGCYWCVEFNSRSKAVEAMAKIIENAENNGDVVDKDWLIEKYGKATC
jgi:hypothetical protein